MNRKTQFLTQSALVASLYIALTYVSALLGLASGMIQIRLSEMLTVLPAFSFSTVPGLFIGCFAANLLTGAPLWDVVFGSMATLLGALGTYFFGQKKYFAPVFPILSNTIIVPFVLKYVYGLNDAYWILAFTIFVGEFISCGVMGMMLYKAIGRTRLFK